ncbi:DUF2500 domain-containing protein [Ornithinibacillus bavariensis]|uniref:Membrane protein n=1 Tax=Ornithinibacillus bavariensis TaxID=545502 RepID=A0A920C8T5_9BACI|nr:DUF2500 domain-containing protein [Ornithinibacillus bavariensis]GIO27927.1 membrane protein [Ornithinibacillus bavariensis]
MNYSFDSDLNTFDFFPIFFTIIFIIVIGAFLMTAVKGISQWRKNENSHTLTVFANVTSKRTDVTHIHHSNDHHHHSSTSYYATFEFESGDRQEFQITARDYSQIANHDQGKLTFRGTRFLGFERDRT